MKLGDVLHFRNGKTAEIHNTDAEGRLVLADVLSYAARYEPAAVLDAATLTGACVIALGHTASGVMGNDAEVVREHLAQGLAFEQLHDEVDEPLARLAEVGDGEGESRGFALLDGRPAVAPQRLAAFVTNAARARPRRLG